MDKRFQGSKKKARRHAFLIRQMIKGRKSTPEDERQILKEKADLLTGFFKRINRL